MIENHLPRLVAAKFGGAEGINLSQIMRDTGLNYATVSSWVNGEIKRVDFPVLDKWCEYLECEPGDILKRKP